MNAKANPVRLINGESWNAFHSYFFALFSKSFLVLPSERNKDEEGRINRENGRWHIFGGKYSRKCIIGLDATIPPPFFDPEYRRGKKIELRCRRPQNTRGTKEWKSFVAFRKSESERCTLEKTGKVLFWNVGRAEWHLTNRTSAFNFKFRYFLAKRSTSETISAFLCSLR